MNFNDQNFNEITSNCRDFQSMVRKEDVSKIISQQQNLLSHLEKTNAMLQTVNELSNQRLESLNGQMRSYARTIIATKRELNTILKRVNSIQKILQRKYPVGYQIAAEANGAAWKAELDALPEAFTQSPQSSISNNRIMEPLPE